MIEDTKIAAPVEGLKPVTEAPKETPKADPDKERFAHLARLEKQLRAQAREIQRQAKVLEQSQKPTATPSDWKQELKIDPIGKLQQAGYTKDEIANMLLGQQADPVQEEIRGLKAQIEALKGSQDESVKKIQASQTDAYERAVKQVAREVNNLVLTDEAYATIRASKAQDSVVELIKSTYEEDGILLTAIEAAKQVEDYLLDEAVELAKLQKVQAKLVPPTTETKSEQKIPVTSRKASNTITTQPRTLTNNLTSSSSSSISDRRQRAIMAFKGQLS